MVTSSCKERLMSCAGQWWETVSLYITPDTTAKRGPRRGTSHRVREVDQKTISTSLAGDSECVERGQGPAYRLWRNALTTLWGLGKGRQGECTLPQFRGVLGTFPLTLCLSLSLSLSLFLSLSPFLPSYLSSLFPSFFPSLLSFFLSF